MLLLIIFRCRREGGSWYDDSLPGDDGASSMLPSHAAPDGWGSVRAKRLRCGYFGVGAVPGVGVGTGEGGVAGAVTGTVPLMSFFWFLPMV